MDALAIPKGLAGERSATWRGERSVALSAAFDFAVDGKAPDERSSVQRRYDTALLEASVASGAARAEDGPASGRRFSSIPCKRSSRERSRVAGMTWSQCTHHDFTCVTGSDEDRGNLEYLRESRNAGRWRKNAFIRDWRHRWDATAGTFVDETKRKRSACWPSYIHGMARRRILRAHF